MLRGEIPEYSERWKGLSFLYKDVVATSLTIQNKTFMVFGDNSGIMRIYELMSA